jgi:hypothetical protein
MSPPPPPPAIIDDGGVGEKDTCLSGFSKCGMQLAGDPGNKIWILSLQFDPESAAITAPLEDSSLLAGAIERSWIARL